MQSKNSSHEQLNLSRGETRPRFTERLRESRLAYAGLGATATVAVLVPGMFVGLHASAEHIKEQFGVNEEGVPVGLQPGRLEVQNIDLELSQMCMTSHDVLVTGTKVEVAWDKDKPDRKRQVELDLMVTAKFCQDRTTGKPDVDNTEGQWRYDTYIAAEDIYLDTEANFEAKDTDGNSTFHYKFTGTAGMIPEGILDTLIENTRLKDAVLPGALGYILDARESKMVEMAVVQAQVDAAKKCGPTVAPAIEDKYKEHIIAGQRNDIAPMFPEIEDYSMNVYIGGQTPENPDAKVEYSFNETLQSDLVKMKASDQVNIMSGEVGECELAEDITISSSEVME